jgi:hypothetical protein
MENHQRLKRKALQPPTANRQLPTTNRQLPTANRQLPTANCQLPIKKQLILNKNNQVAQKDVSDLKKFLKPFPAEVQETTLWLRDFVWKLYPKSNELIYDNYNALAFGWSPTDRVGHVFCNIAVGRTSMNIFFGFYWGNQIADPEKMLIGNGKQYRYIPVKNQKDFPKMYMKKLMKEAYINSLLKVKDQQQIMESKTIVKSISTAKRAKKKKKS